MDFETELACFNPAEDLAHWVSASFSQIKQTLITRDTELLAAQLKIQALTLELAHHRRIRFGHKNEALSPDQRDLFQETWHADLAAMEARLAQATPVVPVQTKRSPTGRQALPDHLPRIEHRHEPES